MRPNPSRFALGGLVVAFLACGDGQIGGPADLGDGDGDPQPSGNPDMMYGTEVYTFYFPGTRWWQWNVDADPQWVGVAQSYREKLKETHLWGVLGNAGKFPTMHYASQAEFYFDDIDIILGWFESNGRKLKYHALAWDGPGQSPDWYLDLASDLDRRSALIDHITTIVTRYKGRIEVYDVINHPIRGYLQMGGDENNFMLTGWTLREAATNIFTLVRSIDPNAKLIINEGITSTEVLDSYVALVRDLLSAGVPIDGIGEMAHFGKQDGKLPSDESVVSTLDQLAATGLPVYITEFDISYAERDGTPLFDPELPFEGFDNWWEYQGWAYKHLYQLASSHAGVQGVFNWGFYDGQHWRPGAGLFTETFEPKPNYYGLLNCGFLYNSPQVLGCPP